MRGSQKNRQGFSLILSLTVMAMLVLCLVVTASLISVEARLASNSQQMTRAKLNAIVSLKLALGHLQQEAGPDQRSTARADITQPGVIAAKLRNPMWTGVWRTDYPDMPPAWLVSGRHDAASASAQSISLGPTAEAVATYNRFRDPRLTADYPSATLTPWGTTDYTMKYNSLGSPDLAPADYSIPDNQAITLVGTASATPEAQIAGVPSKPSGLVTLARVPLPGAANGDGTVSDLTGSYAYWIGDEGIKARINLTDSRKQTAPTADQLISLRSPSIAAFPLLPGLSNLNKQTDLSKIDRTSNLGLISGFLTTDGVFSNCDKRLFHDISLTSAGVLADSANGGLKRDLSTAFELSDTDFAASEFGTGIDATGLVAAGSHNISGYEANTMPIMNSGNGAGAKPFLAAPVFNRSNFQGGPNSTIRGPTWWALRDYHRLYKQLGWSSPSSTAARSTGATPTLIARSFYPNAAVAHPEGAPLDSNSIRNRLYTYSDVFNGDQLATNPNPNAADYASTDTSKIIPRPVNCAISPYVSRVQLVFSVNKTVTTTTSDPVRVWNASIRKWQWVVYTYTTAYIELNLTPVITIHNPYNVALQFRSMTSNGDESVAISFSDMSKWNFVVRNYANPGAPNKIPLSSFFNMQATTTSTDADTFKVFLPKDVVIAAGETRVFSCPPGTQSWNQAVKLSNSYSTTGGFFDHADNWGFGSANIFDFSHPIGMQIDPSGGNFRMRHALTCWPNDNIKDNGSTVDFFFNCSEQAEVLHKNINPAALSSLQPAPGTGYPKGEKFFTNYSAIHDKYDIYGNPNEPSIISVIEIAAKTADAINPDPRSTSYASPFPILTHSNPFAASIRPDGAGRDSANIALAGPIPSYELKVMTPDSWDNLVELVPKPPTNLPDQPTNAYNGYSRGVDGSPIVVLAEVPLVQPTSLAQYTHANFGVRDQQPLFSIGNSFASPFVPTENAWYHNATTTWSEYDQTYLLNTALWDGYFLSSIAPQMTVSSALTTPLPPLAPRLSNLSNNAISYADSLTGQPTNEKPSDTGTTPNTLVKKEDVISAFVGGTSPLDNPRLSLSPPSTGTDPKTLLGDYRRSASALLNLGAFNVNSTSVDAWKVFLGSTRKLAAFSGANSVAGVSAPLPRTIGQTGATQSTGDLTNPSNWNGVNSLTDDKIAALAQAIVDENKLRFQTIKRTEWDQSVAEKPIDPTNTIKPTPPARRLFRGLSTPSTPYLSLSEFINRFLCSTPQVARCGALQAAIFRADQNANAGLSDRLVSGVLTNGGGSPFLTKDSISTLTSSWSLKPENIELISQNGTSRTHSAMGAPGNLLQSDLLQSLGPALASRSDTFTIRCYGDAGNIEGATAKTWIEATVQRTPEFVDASNAPETGVSAPRPLIVSDTPDTSGAPAALSRIISPVNHALGRRFKVISVRWLTKDEI